MKLSKRIFLGIIVMLSIVNLVIAWTWIWSKSLYEPKHLASEQHSANLFNPGSPRVVVRLAKESRVGDPNYGSTLQSAVAALGASRATVHLPPGTHDIASNFTIPANITLKLEREAILSISTDKILVINGGLEAGLYQIFSCTGTGKVLFGPGSVTEVHPEWWGAIADNSTACLAAFQAAVDTGLNVKGAKGAYLLNGCLNFNASTGNGLLEGMGSRNSILSFSHTNDAGIRIAYAASGMPKAKISGFQILGPGTSSHPGNYGIHLPGAAGTVIADLIIKDCWVWNWGDDDIRLKGPTGPVQIKDCYLYDTAGNGITITEGANLACPQNVTISGGAIQGNIIGAGIYVDGGESTVTGLNIDSVDIEIYAPYGTKPAIYLRATFGTLIKGLTTSNNNASMALGDALIYTDVAVNGTTFLNCLTNAGGGLNNFHLCGAGLNNSIISGFHTNSATPPEGLGYFCKITGAGNTTISNPFLSNVYAVKHGVVYDGGTYGSGLVVSGVDVIRLPGTGGEIVWKPKTAILAQHTNWNPGTVNGLSFAYKFLTIDGALTSDDVEVFPRTTSGGMAGFFLSAYVDSPKTVVVSLFNGSGRSRTFTNAIPLDIYIYRPSP